MNYHLVKHKTIKNYKDGAVLIGSYSNKYLFYICKERIYCCFVEDFDSVFSWASVLEMVLHFIEVVGPYYKSGRAC